PRLATAPASSPTTERRLVARGLPRTPQAARCERGPIATCVRSDCTCATNRGSAAARGESWTESTESPPNPGPPGLAFVPLNSRACCRRLTDIDELLETVRALGEQAVLGHERSSRAPTNGP